MMNQLVSQSLKKLADILSLSLQEHVLKRGT